MSTEKECCKKLRKENKSLKEEIVELERKIELLREENVHSYENAMQLQYRLDNLPADRSKRELEDENINPKERNTTLSIENQDIKVKLDEAKAILSDPKHVPIPQDIIEASKGRIPYTFADTDAGREAKEREDEINRQPTTYLEEILDDMGLEIQRQSKAI